MYECVYVKWGDVHIAKLYSGPDWMGLIRKVNKYSLKINRENWRVISVGMKSKHNWN